MNKSAIRVKRIIKTLQRETENVRKNPSEENYKRAEKALENAGKLRYYIINHFIFFSFLLFLLLFIIILTKDHYFLDLLKNKKLEYYQSLYVKAESGLKLRKAPGLTKQIMILKNNQRIFYLGLKSESFTKIIEDGEVHYGSWIRIKTENGIEGWVYDSYVSNSKN